jgi:hypothetical protein
MKYMLLFVLLFVSFTAAARDPFLVVTYTSESNQSLDDFAVAIAKKASREGFLLDAEVCGEFQKQGDVYVIELWSTDATTWCNYNKRINDPSYTNLSFHTHLQKFGNVFSDSDYDHPGYLAYGHAVKFQSGRGGTERVVRR